MLQSCVPLLQSITTHALIAWKIRMKSLYAFVFLIRYSKIFLTISTFWVTSALETWGIMSPIVLVILYWRLLFLMRSSLESRYMKRVSALSVVKNQVLLLPSTSTKLLWNNSFLEWSTMHRLRFAKRTISQLCFFLRWRPTIPAVFSRRIVLGSSASGTDSRRC